MIRWSAVARFVGLFFATLLIALLCASTVVLV